MTELTKGGNTVLNANFLTIDTSLNDIGTFDVTALGVDANNKIYAPGGNEYMALFSQPETPDGAVKLTGNNKFSLDLSKIPQDVQKIVIAASLEEGSGNTMASLTSGHVNVTGNNATLASYNVTRQSISGQETSLILGEVYRNNSNWKFRAVGQGFNDGFAALLKSYGVVIEDAPASAPAPAPVPAAPAVNLQKQRLVQLEKANHPLVSLAKKAHDAFEKAGLGNVPAMDVRKVIDTSTSMTNLFQNGVVQRSAERSLGAAAILDDDGRVPLYRFDRTARRLQPDIDLNNFQGHIARVIRVSDLVPYTNYAPPIEMIRADASKDWVTNGPVKTATMPCLVLFDTDGDNGDKEKTRELIRALSREPVFIIFNALGHGPFEFLDELDTLKGRYLDNAAKILIPNPDQMSDEKLYAEITKELSPWIKQAREFGLLADNPHAVKNDTALMQKIVQRDQQAIAELPRTSTQPRRGFNPF